MTRRALLRTGIASTALATLPSRAESPRSIHVVKGTGCACCEAWVAYLREAGFVGADEEIYGTLLIRCKLDKGVPQRRLPCHTGLIAGYVLAGHVPVADINRLLNETPDAIGLTVPGMPFGLPGMVDETDREPYDVFSINREGTTEVFASYPEA